MKKFFALALMALISVSAFAFDFAGKKFSLTDKAANGKPVTISMTFTANKVTLRLSGGGGKTQTHTSYWEDAGGYINVSDPSGDFYYLEKDDDDGEMKLILEMPGYGERLVLRQVKNTTQSKKSTKRRR